MPLLAIWCSFIPNNLEATSITLFTGILNLSGNFSNYIGAFITYLTKINKENLDLIYLPLLIQNIYSFMITISLINISFPTKT
jgi:hypothetical protein